MSEPATASAPRRQPSLRLILFWQQCDWLSGALLCAMVVFSTWAFGATTPWAIRVMNFAGYALGGLLAFKFFIRWYWNYRPARWDDASASPGERAARALTVALAVLTLAILAYCAVAALNARATYDEMSVRFNYREFIRWLPHSYDRDRTWRWR